MNYLNIEYTNVIVIVDIFNIFYWSTDTALSGAILQCFSERIF